MTVSGRVYLPEKVRKVSPLVFPDPSTMTIQLVDTSILDGSATVLDILNVDIAGRISNEIRYKMRTKLPPAEKFMRGARMLNVMVLLNVGWTPGE